jgi:RNA polymerase sigma-70 factor (ECF subfamily)
MSAEHSTDSTSDSTFQVFLEGLRHNNAAAWRELLARYSARLIGLARGRLFDGRLRQKLDADDVVQSVWRTFVRRHRLGQFKLSTWDSLWGLLITLTVFRVCKWDQHFNALKRALDREEALDRPGARDEDESSPAARLADPGPTPLEVLEVTETVKEKLAALGEKQRGIIELGLLGHDDGAIARQVGRTEARVRQIRDDFILELFGLLGREGHPAS